MFLKSRAQKMRERFQKALDIKGVTKSYVICDEDEKFVCNAYDFYILRANKNKTWDILYNERGQDKKLATFYYGTQARLYLFWLLQDLDAPWDVTDLD